MNVHESEKLAGILESMGFECTNDDEKANVIVFNTCCIRDNAEERVYGNIGAIKKMCVHDKTKIVAVVGCMTQQKGAAEKLRKTFPFVDIVLGTSNLDEFKHALEVLKRQKKFVSIKPPTMDASMDLPIYRTSYPNAWINIMYGCNNFCTYCIVPYVRGRERSRAMEDIINDCKKVLAEGYKEITLLGQNVDSYGSDLENVTFADLLERIASIEGKFRLRFMTSHPKDINERTIEVIAKYPNICNNVHLPVQSGSTKVLGEMNRKYTREEYLKIISSLREKMPDVGITTDIMVGFPTETEADYQDTLSLVKEVRFSNAFTFVYSPRKGTPAAEMVQLDESVQKSRVVELIALQNSITKEISDTYTDKIKEILVEDVNPKYEGTVCGRTECGRLVTFKGDKSLIGQFVNVRITRSQSASLFGDIVE